VRDKLSVRVDFPLTDFDLGEFVIGPDAGRYALYAVSNHFGSLGGGHYTSYCFHEPSGLWYEFNDSRVIKLA
jgi:ubiquitin C-terminal hydrolase